LKKLTTGIIFFITCGFGHLYAAEQSAIQQRALEKLGKLPLAFEMNRGQTRSDIDFIGMGADSSVYIKSTDALFLLANRDGKTASRVNLNLVGSRKSSGIAEEKIPGYTNSYMLHGMSWTRFDKYGKVRYRDVWPGIDMVYYGTGRDLEFDFVVAPGKDAGAIRLRYSGDESVALNDAGDLEIRTPERTLIQHKPSLYQDINGGRHAVNGHYVVARNREIRFVVDSYDRTQPLVIDPVVTYAKLTYSDSAILASITAAGYGVAIDNALNAYFVGKTTPNLQQNGTSRILGFLFQIPSDTGSPVVTSFILGRPDGDTIFNAVAVDSTGHIYITGSTSSPTLAVGPNGFQPLFGEPSANGNTDAFLVVFSSVNAGAATYFSYIGGAGNDVGNAIALDPSGYVYIAGTTSASNFPVTVGSTYHATGSTGFLVKANPNVTGGASRIYSTLIGGTGTDTASSVVVDPAGDAFVGGTTTTPSSTFQPSSNQGVLPTKSNPSVDGYIVGVAPSGASAKYLTFFINAPVNGLAYGTYDGFVYAVGQTSGSIATNNIPPVTAGYQSSNNGGLDAWLAKLDPNKTGGTSLLYFTYLGGSQDDIGYAVGVDQMGNAFIAGKTSSPNFPTLGNQFLNTAPMAPDAFAAKINTNAAGTGSLIYSGLLGGNGSDEARAGVVDMNGNFYLTGITSSSNYPVTPMAGNNQNGVGAFATKLTINCASKPGVFRQGFLWALDANGNHSWESTDIVYNVNSATSAPESRPAFFALGGIQGDIPVYGDWNGSGTTKAGIFRPNFNAQWVLDWDGTGKNQRVYYFGQAGDLPVVGKWTPGDPRTRIGVFRQGFLWIEDTNGDGAFNTGDAVFGFGGVAGDIPVVGDWDGSGYSKAGLWRQNFLWILDANGNRQIDAGDYVFPFGGYPGDIPLVGDWNGSGTTKVGVWRQNFLWVLDTNGNHQIDPLGGDMVFGLGGYPGDIPVVGCW
jgi:hypothetical protein